MQQPFAGLTVLVLEDEYLIAMEIEQICKEAGAADVRLAGSLDEAVMLSGTTEPDVVVIDLNLRGESTLDFARSLREQAVPFLFATGMADLSGIKAEFSAVTVVKKPYDSSTLVNAIAATARGSPAALIERSQ